MDFKDRESIRTIVSQDMNSHRKNRHFIDRYFLSTGEESSVETMLKQFAQAYSVQR